MWWAPTICHFTHTSSSSSQQPPKARYEHLQAERPLNVKILILPYEPSNLALWEALFFYWQQTWSQSPGLGQYIGRNDFQSWTYLAETRNLSQTLRLFPSPVPGADVNLGKIWQDEYGGDTQGDLVNHALIKLPRQSASRIDDLLLTTDYGKDGRLHSFACFVTRDSHSHLWWWHIV
jgi:hypothetical protein